MKSLKRSLEIQRGFTLLEVLVASAIFVFAATGIIQMFTRCTLLDQANREKSIATTHAQFVMEDIMEYMRNNELSSLQSQIVGGTWHWNSVNVVGAEMGCTAPYAYPCVLSGESVTTTYSDTDPTNHPPQITVVVSWKNNRRELTLKTLISKR